MVDATPAESLEKGDIRDPETTDGSPKQRFASAPRDAGSLSVPAHLKATGDYTPSLSDPSLQLGQIGSTVKQSAFPVIPGYEILGEIGRGGMGVVYRARHLELNRPVAIKMILGSGYSDALAQARFLIEAEVIAAVQHPNIVQVFEFGRLDYVSFFVLEFVQGGTLANTIRTKGKMPAKEAAALVVKLARAMAAAHQKGVIHRDLKPANVLLDERSEPKITDFGLAKTGQSDLTETGVIMGTPSYMSPEQAAGKSKEVGTPTDVYSLGAILYELLTGRPPFRSDTAMSTIHLVLNSEPVRPRSTGVKIPRDLETICLKCLEKDPRRRYATCTELAADLQAFLSGQPTLARPVGMGEWLWKLAMRNPAWTTSIVTGTVLLIGAGAAVQSIRANSQQQQKQQRAVDLVHRLLDAKISQVPSIIASMAEYRPWVEPLLHREAAELAGASPQKLAVSLALFPSDPTQAELLSERLLDSGPQEFAVIREALMDRGLPLSQAMWTILEDPDQNPSRRFRAACVLSTHAPDDKRWRKTADEVASMLVSQNAFELGYWTDAIRTANKWLLPALAKFLVEEKRNLKERGLIAAIYGQFANNAEGHQHLFAILDEQPSYDGSFEFEQLIGTAKRKASAAIALLHMDQADRVWPLLKQQPEPTLRSLLIDRMGPAGINPDVLIDRFFKESDVSARSAILLAIGEYSMDQISAGQRRRLHEELLTLHASHPDPGMHGAIDWLLRHWRNDSATKTYIQRLATGRMEGNRHWLVNRQGITLSVVPAGARFRMGLGKDAKDVALQHGFALATKEITIQQFRRFRPNHPVFRSMALSDDCPVSSLSWCDAAAFCNWLSEQDGIPKDQWVFLPNDQGEYRDGMKIVADAVHRTGYRLPTEAEWEYCCRAGAESSFCMGEAVELLAKYAWHSANANAVSHPVGELRPNNLGMFDIHGNLSEWCLDRYEPLAGSGLADVQIIRNRDARVLRGGSHFGHALSLRPYQRFQFPPLNSGVPLNGFRPARTLTP